MTEPLVAQACKDASAPVSPTPLEEDVPDSSALKLSDLVAEESSLMSEIAIEEHLDGRDLSSDEADGAEADELLSCGSLGSAARSVLLLLLLPGTGFLTSHTVPCRANNAKALLMALFALPELLLAVTYHLPFYPFAAWKVRVCDIYFPLLRAILT
jgi:hypothetical protein